MWAIAAPGFAQLVAAKDGPVVYGHHHLNVTSVAEQTKFWSALGGVPITKIGSAPVNVFKFQNVFVFLNERAPSGGTKGTSVNHVGFTVPNVRAVLDKLAAAGYPIITKGEVPPSLEVKNDVAFNPDLRVYIAYVMAPDNIKVEFVQDDKLAVPITLDHVHFATPKVEELRAWYVKVFSARAEKQGTFEAAVLPGVNLRFSPSADPVAGTPGRALDHIGFEVKNLEQFCKDLASRGIQFARPFARFPDRGTANALLTDPSGTSVELTEGLDKIQ
jgi:catechol 2,3-dioxygenase-like lactoylglutathione lyase family enzyme